MLQGLSRRFGGGTGAGGVGRASTGVGARARGGIVRATAGGGRYDRTSGRRDSSPEGTSATVTPDDKGRSCREVFIRDLGRPAAGDDRAAAGARPIVGARHR